MEKFHLVLNGVNSKSQVDRVDMVNFGYHGEWYTLLIIDIIDWNDLEKFVYYSVWISIDIQICDKHLICSVAISKYSAVISEIFILTYFNISDSKAEYSDICPRRNLSLQFLLQYVSI